MKKRFRKLACLSLILMLLFSVVACSNKTEGSATPTNTATPSISTAPATCTPSPSHSALDEVAIDNMNEIDEGDILQGLNKNYNLYGYDILNSPYINARDVKSKPILDQAKFDPSKYREVDDDVKGSEINDYYVEKMSSIYSEINASATVSYKGAAFAGKIQTEYSTSEQTSSKQVFLTYMEKHIISGIEFKGTSADLTNMLSDDFLADVQRVENGTLSAAQLFIDYGTHLILEYYIGGRTRLNFTYTNTQNLKEDDIRYRAEVTYNAVTAQADAETKKIAESFASSAKLNFQSFGGIAITGRTIGTISSQMANWANTIADNPTICGIGDLERSLKPIWELLDSQKYKNAREKLEKEFVEQSKKKSLWLGELDFLDENNAYISDIIVVDGSTEKEAKSYVPSGYKYVCVNFDGDEILDANKGRRHYIFIAYKTSKTREGAITDIIVDLGENTQHKGYKRVNADLNKGVGGEFVYLFYKTATLDEAIDPETKFVREIRGQYRKISNLPSEWCEPSITKDLNSGASGEYIYLMIRKH